MPGQVRAPVILAPIFRAPAFLAPCLVRSIILCSLIACGSLIGTPVNADAPTPAATNCTPQRDLPGNSPALRDPDPKTAWADQLANSRGVICPPGGVDPDMRVAPPAPGGALKVLPPPTSGPQPDPQGK